MIFSNPVQLPKHTPAIKDEPRLKMMREIADKRAIALCDLPLWMALMNV